MPIEIESGLVSERVLEAYAAVPIRFEVRERLRVGADDAGRALEDLAVQRVEPGHVKDYDASPGAGPMGWPSRFDVARWGLLVARRGRACMGGAVVAYGSGDVEMLDGREDLGVLWDLRVEPTARGRGVGSRLFRAAEAWAVERGCVELRVETQDINVRACRLYARQGCRLMSVEPGAYAACPDETRLIWQKATVRRRVASPI
ncbi:MAG: GNAT family N-acetyltransferase [Planctomycetota bacterium]